MTAEPALVCEHDFTRTRAEYWNEEHSHHHGDIAHHTPYVSDMQTPD